MNAAIESRLELRRARAGITTLALTLVLGSAASSCAKEGAPASEPRYEDGYALVYWQASKVQNIDKLLIVKGPSDELEAMTEKVAAHSAAVADELEAFAAARGGIDLEREALPPIEAGARNRMGGSIALELLFSGGCDFEQRLAFTEAVAVLRISALAEEMADQAPDDDQQALWSRIHESSDALFKEVRDLINRCPPDRE